MEKSRIKHILVFLFVAVAGIALIVTGTRVSSPAQYPHETVDGGYTLTGNTTTMPPQETSSTSTSSTAATTTTESPTTTEIPTTTEESQESSSTTTSKTTPLSTTVTHSPSATKPKTSTKPASKPPKTTPKLQGAAAITFDDGPGPHTARLLNALKEYNAKATFFVVGNRVANNKALIQRMVNEGHEIANHSFSHPDFTKLSDGNVLSQIRKTSNAIAAITGEKPTLMRPPYGAFNRRVTGLAEQEGLALVLWSPSPEDWKYRKVDYVYNYILKHVKPGSTLLLHDIHGTTVDAVIKALPVLSERGIKLVTVSELVDLKPGDVHPSYWRK